jgi:hypothetical protein
MVLPVGRIRHLLGLAAALLGLCAFASSAHADDFACFGGDGFEDCSLSATYAAGDAIQVTGGHVSFINDCAEGINDQFEADAKFYIVAAGVGSGDALTDVGAAPNVLQDTGTSGVFDTPMLVGTAAVNVPPGTYDAVIDECEDGKLGPEDVVEPNAITVDPPPPGVVPTISPAIQNIKADAQAQADGWGKTLFAWNALNTALDAYDQASCLMDVIECYLGPDALLGYFQSAVQSWLGVDDPKEAATNVLVNTVAHYQSIAQDPPDANFKQATSLSAVTPIVPHQSDPTFVKAVDMVNGASNENATAAALLHSIERYQGAQAANDPQWALQQAQTIKTYASQLSHDVGATNGLLQTWHDAVFGDARDADFDRFRAGLLSQRDAIKAHGFDAEQLAGLKNAGLSDAQIEALRQKLIADDGLGKTRADLDADVANQIAIGNAAKAKYDALVSDAQSTIDTLKNNNLNQSDGGLGGLSAGGPYTHEQGQSFNVAATCAGCTGTLVYTWDLDGDGQFDDTTAPSVSFATPGDHRIGVKVTRAPQSLGPGQDEQKENTALQNVAYTTVHVTPVNHAPVIDRPSPDAPSPTATTIVMHRGAAQQFTIHPSDADGDALTTTWQIDNAAPAPGTTTLSTTFGAGDALGLHHVTAIVKDDSGLTNDTVTRTWNVTLQGADADADGWSVPADCDDNDPAINPSKTEVLNNGKDDDCNAATTDTGAPAPGGGGDNGGGGQTGGDGSGGAARPAGGGGSTATPVSTPVGPTSTPVKADPCAGKQGKALTACKADQALKVALAKCSKLKGKKKSACVKKARAVRKCAVLAGKKKSTCMRKAAKIRVVRLRYVG